MKKSVPAASPDAYATALTVLLHSGEVDAVRVVTASTAVTDVGENDMIIYGVNPILEAIRSHPERIRYVGVAREETARHQRLMGEAKRKHERMKRWPRRGTWA